MSFASNPLGSHAATKKKGPPKGYVPGLGRGAAGFQTRSDVGPASAPPPGGEGGVGGASAASAVASSGVGSRSAEVRAAKLAASKMQQQRAGGPSYEPGGTYDAFGGYSERGQQQAAAGGGGQYDDDDDEADRIWAAIDERMQNKKKKKRKRGRGDEFREDDDDNNEGGGNPRSKIGAPFRELKEKLAGVTEDEWAAIPENAGDASLRYKQSHQRQLQETFTPLTDSLLEQRSLKNADATAGGAQALVAGTTEAAAAAGGGASTVVNMSGLSQARGTVLGMSLDKVMDTNVADGMKTVVDPHGYLTQMAGSQQSNQISSATNVADVNRARLLLQSVRDTNPRHGPAWIAAARVEEAAGKLARARQIIQQACGVCGSASQDVWLEAARLHPPSVAKSVLASGVKKLPHSIKLFLKAADLETSVQSKRLVLRKALETNPTSVQLWKAAIALEDENDARILLAVAVEKIPHNVDMWLALARLETYENAQKVLNKARKALPSDRSVWIAAAKLEEGQHHSKNVHAVIKRAVASLRKNNAVVTRSQWIAEAEQADRAGFPRTAQSIVELTIGQDVEDADRQRTWSDDAKQALHRGRVTTSRAVLSHALKQFPTKRALWMQAIELERGHGTTTSLDEVLEAACERLPRVEIFWLLRAKEQWVAGNIDKSREILAQAFEKNPDSEQVWLAAAKLEWETGEITRARLLLQRARERASTARVYMKSALFEREQQDYKEALNLIEQGLSKYPKYAKLYMMGGQICSDDISPHTKSNLDRARRFYQRGLQACPNNTVLWTLASRLEERASTFTTTNAAADVNNNNNNNGSTTTATANINTTKARALLDYGRLKNPNNPELWLESVRLERRAGNKKLADALLAKALQECPTSGLLLAESIIMAPRTEQKSKSALAIKKCPDDPLVIMAVAALFQNERKHEKARKWMDRAVILNPDLGDAWARYYSFELLAQSTGGATTTKDEKAAKVKERCIAADPKHGEVWTSVTKDLSNRGKTVGDFLELAAQKVQKQQAEQQLQKDQSVN